MDMNRAKIRERLLAEKAELRKRVDRIHEHARDPLEADSAEQAAQIGNVEVVSALESEAVEQVAAIDAALQRLATDHYGVCVACGEGIGAERLAARPSAAECLDCASAHEGR
jgi:RNA polymerase-binding protein DksA